ncbi:MAG TPA: serine--tRNA ligase [Candidatus Dormibacteraeota bacterium]|nr:serine--tRNA ligase [Candidatus Dormibacteraeota bacterium]
MIDIKHLRENPEEYKRSAKLRGVKVDIDKLLAADRQRSDVMREVEGLRSKLNVGGKPTPAELKDLQNVKEQLEQKAADFGKLDGQYHDLIKQAPNLLAEDTPEGGEESNKEERAWGKAKPAKVAGHASWLQEHDLIDFERGAKVAGAKFYYLKGAAVKLEMAIKRLGLEAAEAAGFLPMDVPHLVNGRIADGTGFNPQGPEQQIYSVEGEDLHLVATAEMPLTGYHADEILDPKQLPALYVGWSPSYRREAGSYGKHSKGLFRVHQFNKLELYVFCAPEQSDEWLQKLVKLEEDICRQLEIPYRVTRTAAGDMGAPHYQKYDVEYWSPAEGEYRELTSAANCTDYQARRLDIRTRNNKGSTIHVHTLNATAAAISRVLIALVENHQTPDGKVKIPKALREYYGSDYL